LNTIFEFNLRIRTRLIINLFTMDEHYYKSD